jgi:LysR family transcriptional regulator, transcriptional activator of nhaA
MEWLNYHHLYYFCAVVRCGGISKASRELRVSSPAISMQLRNLEDSLGEKLLVRSGRELALTDKGRLVAEYGEEIFALGREMMHLVKDRPTGRPLRLTIGVADVLPKMIAQWLIGPALQLKEPVRVVCREGNSDQLVSQLILQELDVVLSDAPISSNVKVSAYSHLLGECGTTFVATVELARKLKRDFPWSLDGAPMLLPMENTDLRRNLDYWFEANGIRPTIAGEFQDYALLRAFGQGGAGIFPIPSVFEKELKQQGALRRIGNTGDVRNRFYAISVDRKLKHPAVIAICDTARRQLFRRDVEQARSR